MYATKPWPAAAGKRNAIFIVQFDIEADSAVGLRAAMAQRQHYCWYCHEQQSADVPITIQQVHVFKHALDGIVPSKCKGLARP